MLKMLRYDFYKIFKSKALLGVFCASICLSVFDAFFVWLHYEEATCVFLRLNTTLAVQFLPLVFVAPFACKDFSSKFTKNFYSEYSLKDKICYVLSKVVYIFAACVIWYALYFVSYYALIYLRCQVQQVPFALEGVGFDGTVLVSVSEGTLSYFCLFASAFAVGMLVLFLSLLMKKEYFVLVVVVLYWLALAWPIYGMLNKEMALTETFHTVEWFTVFGIYDSLKHGTYIPNGTKIMMAGYTKSFLISLGYAVLFILLSCVVVAVKRPYKMKQAVKEGSAVC